MLIPFIGTHPSSKDRWVNPEHIVFVENEIGYTEDDAGRERWSVDVTIVADFFMKSNKQDPGRVMSQMISVHFRKEMEAIEFRNFLVEMHCKYKDMSCFQQIADSLQNLVAILNRTYRNNRVSVLRRVRKSSPTPTAPPAKKTKTTKGVGKTRPNPNWHRSARKKEVSGDE